MPQRKFLWQQKIIVFDVYVQRIDRPSHRNKNGNMQKDRIPILISFNSYDYS